jgi:putative CocE/NonD family hydrolase
MSIAEEAAPVRLGERGQEKNGVSSRPEYGIIIAKDVMVPMRDGARLATDIYRVARDGEPVAGSFPTILGRTSYDKTSPQQWVDPVANFFVPRGYVVVLQDLRGRHRSEGTGQYFHTANVNEGPDGYDTIEWIAAQSWSNGRVGMVGSSHGAIVQQVAALYRPPHLTAMWPDVGPTNAYANEAREGGAMSLHMFGALFLHAHDAQEIRDDKVGQKTIVDAMEHLEEWVWRTPFRRGMTPLSVVPNLEEVLLNYYTRGSNDEWWQQDCMNQEAYFNRHADIPGVYSSGWYDAFGLSEVNYYAAMARKNHSPQRLIMGPWTHMTMRGSGSSVSGDVDFGPDAVWGNEKYNQERLRWFDRWLKDMPTRVEDDPPVRIFVMGGGDGSRTRQGHLYHGGQWRDENEWPLARTQYTNYYFHSDGLLTPELPASGAQSRSYNYDPDHPVPTVAATATGFFEMVPIGEGMNEYYVVPRARMHDLVLVGAANQEERPGMIGAQHPYPPLALRPDVLVFQTPPLERPTEITGEIQVTLWIASSAVDTDFTAKLVDVHPANEDYPNGYAMNLVDSIIRTRYRDSWEHEELMVPGEVYQVRIRISPTSNLFTPGHRIRLEISSSNFPRFDRNPNTGEPVGQHTHAIVARNTVYCDRDRPSHVTLPIIPTG